MVAGGAYRRGFGPYVDDAAFILMNRQDAETAAALIVRHFRKFGLTIHVGNREKGTKSKTEALYVPSMWRGSNYQKGGQARTIFI